MAEDSRLPSITIVRLKYLAEANPQMFTPTNLVHHLKTKPGHEEEYEKYN